jgi:hypothetical protein
MVRYPPPVFARRGAALALRDHEVAGLDLLSAQGRPGSNRPRWIPSLHWSRLEPVHQIMQNVSAGWVHRIGQHPPRALRRLRRPRAFHLGHDDPGLCGRWLHGVSALAEEQPDGSVSSLTRSNREYRDRLRAVFLFLGVPDLTCAVGI